MAEETQVLIALSPTDKDNITPKHHKDTEMSKLKCVQHHFKLLDKFQSLMQ